MAHIVLSAEPILTTYANRFKNIRLEESSSETGSFSIRRLQERTQEDGLS